MHETAALRKDFFTVMPINQSDAIDVAQVLEVYRQCEDFLALGPQANATLEMVRADFELSKKEGGVFCGIYDPERGLMMGIIDYVLCGFEGDSKTAFLSLLMIARPYRRHGLGAAVVRWFEHQARTAGAVTIRSGVQVNNPEAIRFWQKMGYQIVSGAEDMGDGTVAYPLEKQLPNENSS